MSIARHSFEVIAEAYPPREKVHADRPDIDVGKFELQTADTLGLSPFSDIRNQIDEPQGSDRSSDAYWLALMMNRDGFTDAQIIGILMNRANPVAAHCVENDWPMRAATRALSAAKRNSSKNGAGTQSDRGAGSSAGGAGEGATGPANSGEVQRLPLIDAASLHGKPVEPQVFMINKLVPESLVTLMTARGGGGKSHTSLSFAASVSLGATAYGMTTAQATAIYITAEDSDNENHRRLIGIANAHGVSLEAFASKLFLLSLVDRREKGLVRIDQSTNKLTILPLFYELRQSILDTGAGFVVLDNVAHLFEGNENIRAHVAAFIGLLNSLALETQCAIILISHPNKAGDSFSGSTAFQNQVRSHIHLEVDDNDPDVRELTLVKANYARLEHPLRLRWHKGAFRLEATIPTGENSATARERLEDQRFLACLDARNAKHLPVSDHPSARDSYAPKVFARLSEAAGMTEAQFKDALLRLQDAGIIAKVELEYGKPGSPGHKATGLARTGQVEASDEPF